MKRALSASFVASLAIQAVNMVTGVLLARELGPENRGTLAAVLLWPTLMGVVGTLGVPEAMTFRVAKDGRARGEVLGSGLVLAAIQSVVFVAVTAALLPIVLPTRDDHALLAAYLFLCEIPLSIVTLTVMGALNGRQRYTWFHVLRLLVVGGALVPVAALSVAGDLTVMNAVLSYIGARTLTSATAIVLLARSETARPSFDREVARELTAYGIKSHASGISAQLNQRADQLLISLVLAPAKLGIYVIASTLSSIGWILGGSIAYVALPVLSRMPAGAARADAARRFVGLTVGVAVVTCIPIAILAPVLVDFFFGRDYHEAADIARILLISIIVFSTNRTIEAVLRAVGRPLDAGLAELFALSFTVVLLAAFLPLFGLLGAATSSLLAALSSGVWMTTRAGRALGIPARMVLVPTRADLHALAARVRSLLPTRS